MGSGRMSPRNRHVASALNAGGIATLLIDLLIGDEINRPELSENIDFLASRLLQATHFIETHRQLHGLPLGYFGASLGAAVALTAAALRPRYIHSIVCRGGRVDLAANAISKITADCLLIVGSKDYEILQINERALPSFTSHCNLDIVLGADHLFEEPGALDELSTKTMRWFLSSFMPAATYTKHAA
jgi:pimeloyl-ACP methyl ester carboxylesterase